MILIESCAKNFGSPELLQEYRYVKRVAKPTERFRAAVSAETPECAMIRAASVLHDSKPITRDRKGAARPLFRQKERTANYAILSDQQHQ